jgi:Methylase involved in ubiquinone/menaquinone biosynthesis
MYNFFKCPKCRQTMSLPTCNCGYTVPYNQNVYQLTNDPYIVKDESADAKYIGYEDIGEVYSGGSVISQMKLYDNFKTVADQIGDGILLDLACGDGLYTVPLLKNGVKVIAMDISDKMLSLLHRRAENAGVDTSNLITCRANALDIPIENESVDAVIANSMLHLISKPEVVVNEIYRVLKKGGKFLTFEDKPSNDMHKKNRPLLSETEIADNKKNTEMMNYIHTEYFQILKDEYNILKKRYSWNFDREKLCDELFSGKETIVIPIENKMRYTLKDSFIYRMSGKGYSDQSDVPNDIHKVVFDRVMAEYEDKYGKEAANTNYTGYEDDREMTVYVK